MTRSNLEDATLFLPFLNEAAALSREVVMKYFRKAFSVEDKDDLTPVTECDREIEIRLRELITRCFPGHGMIGEEYGSENASAEFVWVIDPIDGTKAFATGKPLFGTILGLVHNNVPLLGMIDQAFTKERWIGIADQCCFYNDTLVKVAIPRKLTEARFYTACPEMFQGEYQDSFDRLKKATRLIQYGSDCYAYGLVALGHVDLVVERGLAVHDVMGLVPIVTGAGGYMRDWKGHQIGLDTDGRVIAASSFPLALEAQEILLSNCNSKTTVA